MHHAGADSDVGRSQPGWQSQAEAVLGQMRTAGADFDADSALRLLTRHMRMLQPQLTPEDTFEAATPFSDISSRFSLSGGHRCSPVASSALAHLREMWHGVTMTQFDPPSF